MIYLRQSTAGQEIALGQFLDSTDGDTEESGLTIANTDIKIWKAGATTLASKNTGGATYISNGVYYAVLDATDTDTLGSGIIFVHVSGALSIRLEFCVVTANVYDTMFSTDILDVNVTTISGTAQTANDNGADINAILEDTGTTIPGQITALNDFDPANDTVARVTLVDTTTTNTDMRGTDNAATEAKQDIIDANVDAILVDTSASIPGQITGLNDFDPAVDIVANVTLVDTTTTNTDMRGTDNAATEAKQDIIDTNIDSILVDTSITIPDLITALNDLSAAEVNAQMLDVLNVDTFAEPGQEEPASTNTLVYKIGLLYKALINKKDTDGTAENLYNSDGTTIGQTRTVSDDGSTATKGGFTSGT